MREIDNSEAERIRKIKDLLKFYYERGQEICIENKENKRLDISGKIEELKFPALAFLGKPYIIIANMKIYLEDIDEKNIYPVDTKMKEEPVEEEVKFERKGIGKAMRLAVWSRYFGERLSGKCLCCGVKTIARDDCEMCHIIAVANGGENTVDNLKPGCKDCNRSMGTMDFNEYKRQCNF